MTATAVPRERDRSKGGYSPMLLTSVYYEQVNGGTKVYPAPYQYSYSYAGANGSFTTMRDTVTPNFRRVISEGGIVNTAMAKTTDTRSYTGGGLVLTQYVAATKKLTSQTYTGDVAFAFLGHPAVPPIDEQLLSSLKGVAATSARADVASGSFEGLVFLGEINETLRMIRNPAMGLRQYINDPKLWKRTRTKSGLSMQVKSGKRTGTETGKDLSLLAARSWNEARFGWRPFLLELDALRTLLVKGVAPARQTSRAMQKRVVEKTTLMAVPKSVGVFDTSEHAVVDYTVRCGIIHDYVMTGPAELGFRWADVPSAAYELIPYSFVVDWIVNLGSFIKAMTPVAGSRDVASFTTVRIKQTVTRTVTAITPVAVSGITTSLTGGAGAVHTRTIETFARAPTVEAPRLVVEYDIRHALRSGRAVDALALLISALSGSHFKRS